MSLVSAGNGPEGLCYHPEFSCSACRSALPDLMGDIFADFSVLQALVSRGWPLACPMAGQIALRYTDNYGKVTEQYPLNPNGSPQGITGLTANEGRVTIMMPHPERVFRAIQNSYVPGEWDEDGAWMRMFRVV